ncbi:MAG: DUF302 domain-containing protein [Dehalococcoidia bacterium]|nr:DUF302 domain-containing protein [Dehalococcoidia bacterium]
MTSLGFGVSLAVPYSEAIALTKSALKAHGFGVLTEIDVKATLKEKLAVDMEPYAILGACNPPLAHRALSTDPTVGLLLPCNVVVKAEGAGSRVEFADPQAMLSVLPNPELSAIAAEARQKLQAALTTLTEQAAAAATA